jgi:hypothetical protein
MKIYCCECSTKVEARLTDGAEIYPHRPDLSALPFWKCDACGNSVGCHHKTNNPTNPLGVIANAELKKARQHIHRLIDPVWEGGKMPRGVLYSKIAKATGRNSYHTSHIRTLEEAREVYRHARDIIRKEVST